MRYPWPGNVRELQNFIERAVILTKSDVLQLSALPSNPTLPSGPATLADAKRDHILNALEESNWVVGGASGAAARLGVKRTNHFDQQDAQARALAGDGSGGNVIMQESYNFLIETEDGGHKLLLNGQEIGIFATLDAAEAAANNIANCAVPGANLRFELDFMWTLTDLEMRAATLEWRT